MIDKLRKTLSLEKVRIWPLMAFGPFWVILGRFLASVVRRGAASVGRKMKIDLNILK